MTRTSTQVAVGILSAALGAAGMVRADDALETAYQRWPLFQELSLADDAAAAPWQSLAVPGEVFSAARFDLADLRLVDAQGNEVPYVIRVLRPEKKNEVVEARQFNESRSPQQAWEVSLDLGENPPEHNQVEVDTSGAEFRRAATLEGSDDGRQWKMLAQKSLVRFPDENRRGASVDNRRFPYAPSRFRYLRVRVEPDPLLDTATQPIAVQSITVGRTVDVPGEYAPWTTSLSAREPTRTHNRPSSTWMIEMGGDTIPVDRLQLDVADAELARDYVVEIAETRALGYQFRVSGTGTLTRRADRAPTALEIELPEVRAARVRLNVLDYSNPPLALRGVAVLAAVRELVFARGAARSGPLRLYYGNRQADPPRYDLERTLPALLEPPPRRATLGGERPNPVYAPEPLPVTERWPWLIYVILSAVSLVVGAILVDVGRRAVAAHDARSAEMRAPSV